MAPEKVIMVARVGAPHGVRGQLKLHLFLENPELIKQFKRFYLRFPNQSWQQMPQFALSAKGAQSFIHFSGFDQPETAGLKFTHAELGVERQQLPNLTDNQYYWEDLVGLKVLNEQGQDIGVVDHLMATPAHDVLVIKHPEQKEAILIPYVLGHFIKNVDLSEKIIIVDWEL